MADIVKFKSGQLDNIATTTTPIVAGTVYFAIEDDNSYGSIYFDKDSTHRVKMGEHYAESAGSASQDSAGQSIVGTYLKNISFDGTTDTSKVTAIFTKGDGSTFTANLPNAGASAAGVITTGAQTIAGNKTFTGAFTVSGGVTFSNSNFNYSGFSAGGQNAARVVWFSDNTTKGKPVYDNDFTYNPSTNTLVVTNLTGTASKAIADENGLNFKDNYLINWSVDGSTITLTKGGGGTSTITAPWLLLTGGSVTGPVTFNNAVSIDSLTAGSGIVNGHLTVVNGITGNLTGNVVGNVTGNLTGTADYATKAAGDTVSIRDKYIANVSASGTTLTFTKGDGSTFTVTTQDIDNDIKVNMIQRGTTKAYVLGTVTSPTGTAQAVTSVAETGVYFDTTAGKLVATTFKGALEGNASTATKATQDANGQPIITTYLKNWEPLNNGATIRLTKGGGGTTNIPTPWLCLTGGTITGPVIFGDSVTLDSFTSESGVINGNFSVAGRIYGALTGNVIGNVTGNLTGTADYAVKDSANQNIADTYIKNVSASGTTLTFTKGDGDTFTVTTQDIDNDVKVNMVARGTNKAYVLGTTTAPTSTAQAVSSVAETGVYFDTVASKLVATTFKGALEGNADTATKATNDDTGLRISDNYLKKTTDDTMSGRLTMNNKPINQIITGSGTAARDAGSGASPRYFPAKWTFNTTTSTPVDGDIMTIKIPVAGHSYGVYISSNNGNNYYPVVLNGTGRLTTHYPVNTYITVVFEASGSAASMYGVNGSNSSSTVSGGVWRVINYYDSNSDTYTSAYCGTAAGTAAKGASCTYYTATPNSYIHIVFRYANSSASALTLNINSQGAKPIYINGTASSASNYTLPAGSYLAFYDGTNYYLNTNGVIPGSVNKAIYDDTGLKISDTYISKSIGTAKGDIIYWNASGEPVRLAASTNGKVLKLVNGIPTWDNDIDVDVKVALTSTSTSGDYPLMFGPTTINSGSAYQAYYNSGIKVNPNTKTITATKFDGTATRAVYDDTNNTKIIDLYLSNITVTDNDTKIQLTKGSGNSSKINAPWLPLIGGAVTGAVTFGDSVTIDNLTAGSAVINGHLTVVNGITGNLIGNVTGNLSGNATSATYADGDGTTTSIRNKYWAGGAFSQSSSKVQFTPKAGSGSNLTAIDFPNASTSKYGATKLSSTSSSSEQSLAATPKLVYDSIAALDGSITGSPGKSKTLTTFTQTDGKVTAKFEDIEITPAQVKSGNNTLTDLYLSNWETTATVITLTKGSGATSTINAPWLPLIGGTVTGPTIFGDTVTLDSFNAESGVVNGNLSVAGMIYGNVTGDLTGNATTATSATNDDTGLRISDTYISKAIGTTKGDIIYWSGNKTPVRLGIGSNGKVLKVVNGIPAWSDDSNSDTKVKLTSKSDNVEYPIVLGPNSISSGTAYEAFYNSNIKVNPSTGTITATNFNGLASSANKDSTGLVISDSYVHISGDTMTGALNTANNTANKIGDDSQIGDFNVAGALGIQGCNGNTSIALLKYGDSWNSNSDYAKISYDGTFVAVDKNTSINGIKFYSGNAAAGKTYIGWVKIASFDMNTSNQIGAMCYDFEINRGYNSPAPESYSIRVNTGWGNGSIVQLNGKVKNQIINKFRLVADNTNHICYFEYYVNTSYTTYENTVGIKIVQYHGSNLTLLKEVQTEEDSALSIICTLDLVTGGMASPNGFAGNATSATYADGDGTSTTIRNKYITTGTFTSNGSNVTFTPTTGSGGSGTGVNLPKATTSVYGVTKLSSTSSSSEQGLAATPKLVYDSIAALDGIISGSPSKSKTLSAFSETDGKVSATFVDIEITPSQVKSGSSSIADLYLSNWSTTDTVITLTKGSGATSTISVPWLPLAGGQVTGAVTFGSAVSIDSLTASSAVVNGHLTVVNGITGNLTGNVTGNATTADTAKYADGDGTTKIRDKYLSNVAYDSTNFKLTKTTGAGSTTDIATIAAILGFTSRTASATWGNTTGTTVLSLNDSTGGSLDFRKDNPSSGKLSLKVDGRFYFNEGNTPAAGLKLANSYWGMTGPDGEDNIWIRTTSQGILPYQSGGSGSGHNSIGTSSWYFAHAYIDQVHGALKGTADYASKASGDSGTIRDTYITSITGSDANHKITYAKGSGGTTDVSLPYMRLAGDTVTGASTFQSTLTVIRNIFTNTTSVPENGETVLTALGFKTGYPVYTDPLFESGENGVGRYNNSHSSAPYTSVTRMTYTEAGITSPGTGSNYVIRIQNTGSGTSPGLGGFVQSISSRANAVFVQIFRALVPVGYTLYTASNSMGTSYNDTWLTDPKGTGKWEWYARRVLCGKEGSFSSGGHVYLSGTAGTADAPVNWYLSYCNLYDLTKAQYDGLRTRYADNATKATQDADGHIIADTYISSIVADNTNHQFKYSTGSGNESTIALPYVLRAGDTMTGTLKIDNVDGIQLHSNNKDVKLWEIVGNASSWSSEYGFYELYKGINGGNDNNLELYAHNQTGTDKKVRTVKQDGTVTWHQAQNMDTTLTFNATNGIQYKGTKATYSMIRFKDNTADAYGNGIIIGGGGLSVIGGGESSDAVAALYNGGDEILAFASDGAIHFYSNYQDGTGSENIRHYTLNSGTLLADQAFTIKSASTMYIGSGNGTSLIFQKNGSEVGRWNTSGNLVVGTPSDANAVTGDKLHVEGNSFLKGKVNITQWLRVVNNSSNNSDDALVYIENKNSSDWAQKIVLDTYSYGIRIDGTGDQLLSVGTNNNLVVRTSNVGIGTGSPSYKLHVAGTSYFNENSYFNANVGIGTTSPSYKLHVNGTSGFEGIMQVKKTIRDASGQHFYGGAANRSQWYKITLAQNGLTLPTSSNQWYMVSMTIHVAGDYQSAPRGTIELCYYIYWNKTACTADKVYATGYGPNINKVNLYYDLNDPFIIYVDANNAYTSIWVDYVSYRDSAQSHNTKETKVETTSAITVANYSQVPIVNMYTTNGTSLIVDKSFEGDTITADDFIMNLNVTAKGADGLATAGDDLDLYNALFVYGGSGLDTTTNKTYLKDTMYDSLVRPAIWSGRSIIDNATLALNKVDKDIPLIYLDTSAAAGTDKQLYDKLVAFGWDVDCIV